MSHAFNKPASFVDKEPRAVAPSQVKPLAAPKLVKKGAAPIERKAFRVVYHWKEIPALREAIGKTEVA